MEDGRALMSVQQWSTCAICYYTCIHVHTLNSNWHCKHVPHVCSKIAWTRVCHIFVGGIYIYGIISVSDCCIVIVDILHIIILMKLYMLCYRSLASQWRNSELTMFIPLSDIKIPGSKLRKVRALSLSTVAAVVVDHSCIYGRTYAPMEKTCACTYQYIHPTEFMAVWQTNPHRAYSCTMEPTNGGNSYRDPPVEKCLSNRSHFPGVLWVNSLESGPSYILLQSMTWVDTFTNTLWHEPNLAVLVALQCMGN